MVHTDRVQGVIEALQVLVDILDVLVDIASLGQVDIMMSGGVRVLPGGGHCSRHSVSRVWKATLEQGPQEEKTETHAHRIAAHALHREKR